MSKLTKKDIKAIEELGWGVDKDDYDCYTLENWSPSGGDMVIENIKSKEDIIEYCEHYDAEDEFNCWYGANNGEPSCPGDLWQDCLDKGEMYQALKDVLTK